jgi:hypothetical protein
MAKLRLKPNWGRFPNVTAAALYHNRMRRHERIDSNEEGIFEGVVTLLSSLDINQEVGAYLSVWPARIGEDLVQVDRALQPMVGPNGGVLPEHSTSGQHLNGGSWGEFSEFMTAMVFFITHEVTPGAVLGSDPSTAEDRAAIIHWPGGSSYVDWGNITSDVDNIGRLDWAYLPPTLDFASTAMRKNGSDFDAIINGVVEATKLNNTNYTGGRIITHIATLGSTETAMTEILEIAVWDRSLTDQELEEVHNYWVAQYDYPIEALAY